MSVSTLVKKPGQHVSIDVRQLYTLEERRSMVRESGLVDIRWLRKQPGLKAMSDAQLEQGYADGLVDQNIPPNQFFDFDWVRTLYCDETFTPFDVVAQYCLNAGRLLWTPSAGFDTLDYTQRYLDVSALGQEAVAHYVSIGARERRQVVPLPESHLLRLTYLTRASGLFIDRWYRARYPDMARHENPLEHFLVFGEGEGRQPNPYFDPDWYAREYLHGQRNGALLHYIRKGQPAGLAPSRHFSSTSYLGFCDSPGEARSRALSHFLRHGATWLNEPAYKVDMPGFRVNLPERVTRTKAEKTKDMPFVPDYFWDYPRLDSRPALPAGRSERQSLAPRSKKKYDVVWIIPDFGPGGGGHFNIFRMAKLFALAGWRQAIWMNTKRHDRTGADAFASMVQNYYFVNADLEYVDDAPDEFRDLDTEVVVATDFTTIEYAKKIRSARRIFYFVQDYEPYFHPVGSENLLAENTYRQDVDCICAGPWLKHKMQQHGRWAISYDLAVDHGIYRRPPATRTRNKVPRVVFYCRLHTSRRAVELGIAALTLLFEQGYSFHAELLMGDSLPAGTTLPFPHTVHGTQTHEQLAQLYATTDAALVFSATNYSLLPQEMMACGLPVLEIDTDSTRTAYPPGVVSYVPAPPHDMARALADLLDDRDRLDRQADLAHDWVSRLSWDRSAETIVQGIRGRLRELGMADSRLLAQPQRPIRATVVIPTYNGLADMKLLVPVLQAQRAPWQFEILCIDSASRDGTPEYLAGCAGVRLVRIDKSDFGHGKTRNHGARLAQGEFVVFLTQDAIPTTDTWLFDLVEALALYPNAAGAFGRHIAKPDASEYVRRDLEGHFKTFTEVPLELFNDTDLGKFGKTPWEARSIRHFYSDNNSAMRRSVWERFPYPDVEFGEDQVWADLILQAGYSKVYCPTACVAHSHEYDARETYQRSWTEAKFFREMFNVTFHEDCASVDDLDRKLQYVSAEDERWGRDYAVPEAEIGKRQALNQARMLGEFYGSRLLEGDPT